MGWLSYKHTSHKTLRHKQTLVDHEEIAIKHLRSLDNRQYKYTMEAVEKYREGDRLLERKNKPTGSDKVIDDVQTAFIETEGK